MLTATCNQLLLNYSPEPSAVSAVATRKRPYAVTKCQTLPLKKRRHTTETFVKHENQSPEPQPAEQPSAMDFSLPTRCRAQLRSSLEDDLNSCGSSKASSTSSNCSEDSVVSVESPVDKDISYPTSPCKPSPVPSSLPPLMVPPSPQLNPFTAALLGQCSTSALPLSGYFPLLSPAVDQLSLLRTLTALAAGFTPTSPTGSDDDNSQDGHMYPDHYVINPATGNKVRKNYKNMTRERRMEANARERTRVHTIGETFESLRKLIPCLGNDQKLSKLAILKISCKYIQLMGAIMGKDYTAEQQGISVEECVLQLHEAINSEAKAKQR